MTPCIARLARVVLFVPLFIALFALPTAAMAQPGSSPTVPATQLMAPSNVADLATRLQACTVCHAAADQEFSREFIPRISGKPAGYLYHELKNFQQGHRTYPVMTGLLESLSDDYLRVMADYFAQEKPQYLPPRPSGLDAKSAEQARVLIYQGDANRKIPACVSCHGESLVGVQPFIPGLIGLSKHYINFQMGAWRNGTRKANAPDCMKQIALALSPQEASNVAAYLAALAVPENSEPLAALPELPPMACGSLQ